MSEMVERVAEAIFLKEGRAKDVAWKDADSVLILSPSSWASGEKTPLVSDYYRAIARAAIAAMRDPTEVMKDAVDLDMADKAASSSFGDPTEIWQAMIDSALLESKS